ncbi:MAG: acyl carrier protein [Clostridiales bacterium]|nr:acyl carrier protein [Clostridiales bacterium]MDD7432934.1 acyl carrier protein [Clostridiales bacterium]MDY3062295.1 acyl carrier protein [Eubacteriales bacterium]
MNQDEIFEKVRNILAEGLGIEEEIITMDSDFIDDLNADSLDIVDLVVELEHEFNLSIPDEEAERIKTVGDAVEYIQNNL